MKHLGKQMVALLAAFFLLQTSFGQGRVVINEYMPWTLNGCGASSEFVELMNFGPGPVDIGCYVLTDGDYAVTIPAHTVLQPGQFYVLAGQDVIAAPCANIDSTIHANLNWKTCGCTSSPIPITGDGFFTDGGSANEQVVLLDNNHNVVDAVVRDLPAEPNSTITTSSANGDCGSFTFNLDDYHVNYEILGMSAGRGNSFARKLDGDCGWVKDPQQSANATNNTPSVSSDVVYEFSYVNARDCDDAHGSIDIVVKRGSYDDFFPMNWTLAFDSDNNGVFDFNDQYTYGTDNTPPDIYIPGLPVGNYRITVASVMGCSLKSFDFVILPCTSVLPVKLAYFRCLPAGGGQYKAEWLMNNASGLASVELQQDASAHGFVTIASFNGNTDENQYFSDALENAGDHYYRLKITERNGNVFYSQIISLKSAPSWSLYHVWPNPVRETLNFQLTAPQDAQVPYRVYNMSGQVVTSGVLSLKQGYNAPSLRVNGLAGGVYQLCTSGATAISFRFVKQ